MILNDSIQLYHGDCLEIMKDIPDKSVDMILCDLPYGTTKNRWDVIIPFEPLWKQYNRIIKDNGAIVLFSQTPFDKILGSSNIDMLRYEWIWDKKIPAGHLNAKKIPMKRHENILVFYKKAPTYNPQFTDGKPYNRGYHTVPSENYGKQRAVLNANLTGKRYPVSIIEFSNANRKNKLHPTQKPVLLLEYLIKTYTNENEIVLDNCMGSGSTGVACINTNRKFIGVELDDKYFEIAKERIENTYKNI